MLSRLTVSNLAIVEKAEADFAPGLNVLTGETGAGKSVLMGALELVLGGRADTGVVRDGEKEAKVEAEFTFGSSAASDACAAVKAILDDVGIDFDGESLLVRRTVSASGGGRVWVNDSSSTVATLKRLGRALVDIHGPRANQNILEERFQREALDSFAAIDMREYSKAWSSLQGARSRLESLQGEGASEDELDMLRYQVDELEGARITSDDDEIAERHAAAAHAEEIVDAANEITEALGGDGGAADVLIRLQPRFASVAKRMPAASGWAGEAEELTLRIQELSRTVADAVSAIDVDPETMAALDERLTVLNRLKRKYGADDASALLAVLERKRERLESIENRDAKIAELKGEVDRALAEVEVRGAALSKKRKTAGDKLAKAVTAELHDLGFLQAKFSVRLGRIAPESHGCDSVDYMFEPNPGEAARPLSDIASSGETARVMLALKSVIASHDSTDVLVFDEIDANIGGEVGGVVGTKMRSVAACHQVIAITHLPQSAVFGDRHLVVSKAVSGGRTRTRIESVEGGARVREIARMLGGENSTSVVMRHAEELLRSGRQ